MNKNRNRARLALLLWLVMPPAAAAVPAPDKMPERPSIGLALSGGGARGAAHLGVLRVLDEQRIPVDYIAGTSMGAAVGGLYAAGMSLDELEQIVVSLDWADAFNDRVQRADRSFRRKRDDDQYLVKASAGLSDEGDLLFPAGLVQGQKIDLLLKSFTAAVARVHDFDQLSIPFRAVASDIATGRAVVLGSGDLPSAIRASMSIPAVFSPVRIDNHLLVDGGVTANLPVEIVREMGADIVIAVDISTPLLGREHLTSLISIADQLTTLLTRRNTEEQIEKLRPGDVLIVPALGDIGNSDFTRRAETIALGREATIGATIIVPESIAAEKSPDDIEKGESITSLALDETEYAMYRRLKRKRRSAPIVVDFVRIENNSRLSDEVLAARVEVNIGQPLDILELRREIDELYGLQLFENVHYEVIEEGDRTGIEIYARERSWGPNYLQLGIALSDDFRGQTEFNLALAYTRTLVNRLGGEWRTGLAIGSEPGLFSELYQPLDLHGRFFALPRIDLNQRSVRQFEGGAALAEFRVRSAGAEFSLGRELGTWGEVSAGIRRFAGDADLTVGDPMQIADQDFSGGEYFARFRIDKLDNLNFPRKGRAGTLEWRASRNALNADENFDQWRLEYLAAKSWGRHTLLMNTAWGVTTDGRAPIQSVFRGGGFANLSGFDENALSGQHRGLVSIGYLRRIGDIQFLPAYAGATFEYGNVWENRDDIGLDQMVVATSLFFGLDTFLGPLYFAYGRAEDGEDSLYLFLGRVF